MNLQRGLLSDAEQNRNLRIILQLLRTFHEEIHSPGQGQVSPMKRAKKKPIRKAASDSAESALPSADVNAFQGHAHDNAAGERTDWQEMFDKLLLPPWPAARARLYGCAGALTSSTHCSFVEPMSSRGRTRI
jgi:hypothetical protein